MNDTAVFMQQSDAAQFLSPPSPSADYLDWTNHASALYLSGRMGEALIAARQAVAYKRTPATLLNLAVILETMSDFLPALHLYREAYALDPNDMLVACGYSDSTFRMGL